MHSPNPNVGVHNPTLTHGNRVSNYIIQKHKKQEYFYSSILMNLLYEDLDNRNLDNHTRQIANPNITFDQYIANIKREMGEESDNPNPNPNPTPSRGEGKEGVGRDPNPVTVRAPGILTDLNIFCPALD